MKGDPGPYIETDGPLVWVPRTVPWRDARSVALTAKQDYDERLVYRGKEDAMLLGFAHDCLCEEHCALAYDRLDNPTEDSPCRVPAWKFELVE